MPTAAVDALSIFQDFCDSCLDSCLDYRKTRVVIETTKRQKAAPQLSEPCAAFIRRSLQMAAGEIDHLVSNSSQRTSFLRDLKHPRSNCPRPDHCVVKHTALLENDALAKSFETSPS